MEPSQYPEITYSTNRGLHGQHDPKTAKTTLSANRVVTIVFWDAFNIGLADFLEKGKNIDGKY